MLNVKLNVMGGILIHGRMAGKNVEDAFERLQEKEQEERGPSDYYSGSFTHCTLLGGADDNFDELEAEDMTKGMVYWKEVTKAIPNTNKVKSLVVNYPHEGTRKWITEYDVRMSVGAFGHQTIKSFPKQTDAIKYAREQQEENPRERYQVHITKKLVGDDTMVAEIKYKPSSRERDGEYMFKAVAPY